MDKSGKHRISIVLAYNLVSILSPNTLENLQLFCKIRARSWLVSSGYLFASQANSENKKHVFEQIRHPSPSLPATLFLRESIIPVVDQCLGLSFLFQWFLPSQLPVTRPMIPGHQDDQGSQTRDRKSVV